MTRERATHIRAIAVHLPSLAWASLWVLSVTVLGLVGGDGLRPETALLAACKTLANAALFDLQAALRRACCYLPRSALRNHVQASGFASDAKK